MIVLPSQRNAQVIRDRLMGTPSIKLQSPRNEIVSTRRRMDQSNRERMPSWRKIILEVCDKYQVAYREVIGPSQTHDLVVPRDEAAWRMRQETRMSYPRIAERLGFADHSSSYRAVERHLERLHA